MTYSKKLLDHYENPRNVGSMDKDSTEVGTGLVGAPACGDVMKLQIKVGNNNTIAGGSLIREAVSNDNFINHADDYPKLVIKNKGRR